MKGDDIVDVFTEKIKYLIKKSGKKNKVIAESIGLSDKQFSDLLNGRRIIKESDIPSLCIALETDPNTLFGWNKSA